MRNLVGMLPWAVLLIAAGAGICWLLSKDIAAGKWLLAALIIGHGFIHVMFLVPAPPVAASGPQWPFHIAQSWPVTAAGLNLGLVRVVGAALIAVAGASSVFAQSTALSTAGIVVPAGWWPGSAGVGAVASAIVLIAFFDPQLILGLGIDATLLSVVVARAWAP